MPSELVWSNLMQPAASCKRCSPSPPLNNSGCPGYASCSRSTVRYSSRASMRGMTLPPPPELNQLTRESPDLTQLNSKAIENCWPSQPRLDPCRSLQTHQQQSRAVMQQPLRLSHACSCSSRVCAFRTLGNRWQLKRGSLLAFRPAHPLEQLGCSGSSPGRPLALGSNRGHGAVEPVLLRALPVGLRDLHDGRHARAGRVVLSCLGPVP